jgi:hypothetical protein
MLVPIGVLGLARESPKPNHWFKVVDDRDDSGGFFILHGWDGVDDQGRRFEFDDWVESLDLLMAYFERLPWPIDWVGSA